MDKFLDERNASYDTLAKRFLARKSILARILKYTVEEFADCPLADIEKKYIEGDPIASINTIPLSRANTLNRIVLLNGLSLSILFSTPLLLLPANPLSSLSTLSLKKLLLPSTTNL